MKTKSTTTEILIIALLLIPIAYLGIIWSQLPAEITVHYDLKGNPNGWAPKETAALEMGGISIFMYVLLRFLPYFDPRGKLQTANYQKLRLMVTLLLSAITTHMFYTAADPTHGSPSMGKLMALVGLLFAGMGNYLTTVKPNWFVGIRTPWTMDNEVVWRETHRLGGRLMVIGGVLSAVLALLVPMPYTVGVVVGIIVIASLIPVVYSYIYFRQEKAHQLN